MDPFQIKFHDFDPKIFGSCSWTWPAWPRSMTRTQVLDLVLDQGPDQVLDLDQVLDQDLAQDIFSGKSWNWA